MHKNANEQASIFIAQSLDTYFCHKPYFQVSEKKSLEQIVFESEETLTLNTLKDFSFPYKLKGKANNPPMSFKCINVTNCDILKRFRRLIRRVNKSEFIRTLNINLKNVSNNSVKNASLDDDKIEIDALEKEKEKIQIKETIFLKNTENLNVNIKFIPEMIENFNQTEKVKEIVFQNIISNKENIIDLYLQGQNAPINSDKDNSKLLENIFYPYKTMDNHEFESIKNNTLLLYQIKKEEVEKILNLTQSIEEQDVFIPEKGENRTGKYFSEHLCEIVNVDQRPVKKVFMVFPKKNDFRIDLDIIQEGRDKRTTCMIKNIPNKYTQTMLVGMLDEHHKHQYDFIYLRMDFKNKCNVGYAFVNFIDYNAIPSFYKKINGKGWVKYKSNKIAELTYASIQGIDNLIKKFKKSNIMWEIQEYRPKVYYRDGPFKGMEWDVMNND